MAALPLPRLLHTTSKAEESSDAFVVVFFVSYKKLGFHFIRMVSYKITTNELVVAPKYINYFDNREITDDLRGQFMFKKVMKHFVSFKEVNPYNQLNN